MNGFERHRHAPLTTWRVTVVRFFETALLIQKRLALHEEGGKCRHRDIGEQELAVFAGTRVGQCFEDGREFVDQIVDR